MPAKPAKTNEAVVRQKKEVESTTAMTRIQARMQPILEWAQGLVISDNMTYERAGESRKMLRGAIKDLDELLDPNIKRLYVAHRESVSEKKAAVRPYEETDQALMTARIIYERKQEQIRRMEEQRLLKAAQEQEEERRMQEATRLAEEGRADEAVELLEEPPAPVQIQKVESTIPVQEGMGKRTTWSAEVTDFHALVVAVARGEAPMEALEPSMPFLNKQAQAFHGGLMIAGVRAVGKASESVRGA